MLVAGDIPLMAIPIHHSHSQYSFTILIHSILTAYTEKKAFNGVITKFIDNFGFVDDDVFFRIE